MGGALELGGRGLVELPAGAAEVDVPNGSPPKKSPPPPPAPVEAELEDCGWVWSNEGHIMHVHVLTCNVLYHTHRTHACIYVHVGVHLHVSTMGWSIHS